MVLCGTYFCFVAMLGVSSIVFLVRARVIHSFSKRVLKTALCALHPFSAAHARLEAFHFCLKKWCSGDEIDMRLRKYLITLTLLCSSRQSLSPLHNL